MKYTTWDTMRMLTSYTKFMGLLKPMALLQFEVELGMLNYYSILILVKSNKAQHINICERK